MPREGGRHRLAVCGPPARWEYDYSVLLGEIKERIRAERVGVVLAANQAMMLLYWDIGKAIVARQRAEGWGAGPIDRLSHDLREAFPDMRGFSTRNLKYMRAFAQLGPDAESCSRLLHKFRGSTTACFSTRRRIAEPVCGT